MPPQISTAHDHVTAVSIPWESQIGRMYSSVNLADAFSVELPQGSSTDPELLARFIFSTQPAWIRNLTAARDALVAGLGLKTAKELESGAAKSGERRVAFMKIYNTSPTEIVLGEDDRHLDFRLSVLCTATSSLNDRRKLVMSTVVHCHNAFGRLYLNLIAPFHRAIVQASLRHAARVGWPRSEGEASHALRAEA